MKLLIPLMLILFFGCSKEAQGPQGSVTSGKISSLAEELKQIKEETSKSNHSLSKEELDRLLAEEVITSEEHVELLQLVQR